MAETNRGFRRPMSDLAKQQDAHVDQLGSAEDVERVALAAAEAIERLVAERRTSRCS